MSNNYFEYKGYYGSCEICLDSKELFGKILFIRDLVTYAADSISNMENEFKAEVDDYLEICKELGKNPDKSLTGNFNVRLGSELHKNISLEALDSNESQNEVVKKALAFYFDEQSRAKEIHNHSHNHITVLERPTTQEGFHAFNQEEPNFTQSNIGVEH